MTTDPAMHTITLDLDTITLGEMAATEAAAGRDFTALLQAGSATRRLTALYIHELRTSERPRSWRELGARRPLAELSLTEPSRSAGARPRSPG